MQRLLSIYFLILGSSFAFGQNTIGSISFEGNAKTKSTYLSQFVASKVGQSASFAQLEIDRKQLTNVASIGHVDLKVDSSATAWIVVFEVKEVSTILPLFDFGGVNENIYWQVGLTHQNAFGNGTRFNAFYRNTDRRNNYFINLYKPFIGGSKFGLETTLQKIATREPVYFSDATVPYLYDLTGAELTGHYFFRPGLEALFGAKIFKEEYLKDRSYLYDDTPGPSQFEILKYQWTEAYSWMKTDYSYFYVDGFLLSGRLVQVLNTTDNSWFHLAEQNFKYYNRIKSRGNLAFRLKIGWASNLDSPFAPFVLDSFLNIRGSGNRVERGTGSVVANAEYRHTLIERENWAIQGVGFSDAGAWRQPGATLAQTFQRAPIRWFSGLGARFILKKFSQATFRLDYGFEVNDIKHNGFVLGLGQYF